MICPCGCGEIIELNLLKQVRPCWRRARAREHLDEIATQLSADHEQMTGDITRRLGAAEKDVLDKIGSALPPRPTAAPARSAGGPPRRVN